MKEIWKEVKGYDGYYMISNYGNLKSVVRKVKQGNRLITVHAKNMSGNITKYGYLRVTLSKNNIQKKVFMHRLVAEHFIENNENKKTINHIDCNKLNNHYTNLEWNTHKENITHAIKNGLRNHNTGKDHYKSKLVLDTTNGIYYESITEASNSSRYSRVHLISMFIGRCKNKSNLILV